MWEGLSAGLGGVSMKSVIVIVVDCVYLWFHPRVVRYIFIDPRALCCMTFFHPRVYLERSCCRAWEIKCKIGDGSLC